MADNKQYKPNDVVRDLRELNDRLEAPYQTLKAGLNDLDRELAETWAALKQYKGLFKSSEAIRNYNKVRAETFRLVDQYKQTAAEAVGWPSTYESKGLYTKGVKEKQAQIDKDKVNLEPVIDGVYSAFYKSLLNIVNTRSGRTWRDILSESNDSLRKNVEFVNVVSENISMVYPLESQVPDLAVGMYSLPALMSKGSFFFNNAPELIGMGLNYVMDRLSIGKEQSEANLNTDWNKLLDTEVPVFADTHQKADERFRAGNNPVAALRAYSENFEAQRAEGKFAETALSKGLRELLQAPRELLDDAKQKMEAASGGKALTALEASKIYHQNISGADTMNTEAWGTKGELQDLSSQWSQVIQGLVGNFAPTFGNQLSGGDGALCSISGTSLSETQNTENNITSETNISTGPITINTEGNADAIAGGISGALAASLAPSLASQAALGVN